VVNTGDLNTVRGLTPMNISGEHYSRVRTVPTLGQYGREYRWATLRNYMGLILFRVICRMESMEEELVRYEKETRP